MGSNYFLNLVCIASSGAQALSLQTVFNEEWEGGQGDRDITNDVWEVGIPGDCYDGSSGGGSCAGTTLNASYFLSFFMSFLFTDVTAVIRKRPPVCVNQLKENSVSPLAHRFHAIPSESGPDSRSYQTRT